MKSRSTELKLAALAIVLITLAYVFMTIRMGAVPRAGGIEGHLLGIIGFAFMLVTEIAYSARKRAKHPARWGRMETWMQFHTFTGLVGPYMVLLHTSWKFNGLAGLVTLLTLLIVISGIAELDLWKLAGIDIAKDKGPWYKDTWQGMGPALNTASAMNSYILADRGTWISFKNRGDLAIAVEGDKRLFNQYGVMLVNPAKHPNVKKDLGQSFVDCVISPEGQKAIAEYKIGGEQLFFPNAGTPGA